MPYHKRHFWIHSFLVPPGGDMLVFLLKYLLQQHFGDLWCQRKVFLVTTDVKVSCNVGCTECCFSAMKKSVIRSGIVQLNGSVGMNPLQQPPPKTNRSALSPQTGTETDYFPFEGWHSLLFGGVTARTWKDAISPKRKIMTTMQIVSLRRAYAPSTLQTVKPAFTTNSLVESRMGE